MSERLMFDTKITSTRIAWLDDSTKISPVNYRHFTVYACFSEFNDNWSQQGLLVP